jgi:hypothetical protein
VIIGVTDEKEEVVDKWIATKKKTGYPIAILNGELEKVLGVQHFPYAGVIDPDGNLAYAGDTPEATLKKALGKAKPGSVWPKKLEPVVALVRTGKLGESWAQLQTVKAGAGLDDKDQKALEKFEKFISGTSANAVTAAEGLAKKGMIFQAMKRSEGIAAAKPPLPSSEAAQKLVTELKATPNFDNEMKGGEAYSAAHAKEDAHEFLQAVEAYKDVAKKFEGTKISGVAMKSAQDLVAAGMPGFNPACEACHKAGKACEKHAKVVKL